jgi:hypothetical protein
MDVGEYLVGSAPDGVWNGNTYVRTSRLLILSDASQFPRLYAVNGDGSCSSTPLSAFTLDLSATCRAATSFCMRDANASADALGGNPIPAASIVAIATNAQGAKVSVDNSPVPSTLAPTRHTVIAERSSCADPITAGGAVDLSVTMPAGQKYTMSIGVLQ